MGTDHPNVAISLSNLANVLIETRQYQQARAHFERVIQIWERANSGHTNAAYARNNLAALLILTGHYEEAREQHRRALQTLIKEYGPGHRLVVEALEEYAGWLRAAGRKAEAEEVASRARRIH